MIPRIFLSLILPFMMLTSSAQAADSKQIMNMEIEASKKAVVRDIQGAIDIYTNIIALEPSRADAYLQRGLLYRELGNSTKSMSDAAYAERLVEALFAAGKDSAKLYHQRATAKRLQKRFSEAKQDLQIAMQKSSKRKYQEDMQAVILEEKMK